MSADTFKATIRSGAWGLASLVGIHEAMKFLRGLAAEMENSLWEGPGNR